MIRNISRIIGEEPKDKTYKYTIEYTGSTHGWEDACDTIEEVGELISEIYRTDAAKVTVYDNQFKDYVFYKRAATYVPDIDMLHTSKRDLRTTTRERK